ncbi:phage antirepressor KilAC domain-containing protein [Clostridium phage CWou-2020a]|uniref:Antirepressor n=1 Tax=Clostridium botulinum C/D str. DC5 TaxID=1443128 RepID=A0A0A0I8Y8_CLOBO|nr:phage antirepressor KilAC domain-containing protein [Clostridium botulinum]QPW59437.1 phage antirepressor KilAC domain-containing protein [Clostridium phage CWou-2020a]KGM96105.1 antirepressor [Clostridium botulinum C/D str. DC5]KOC54173.1 antirepressor [Clostridium botulinum]KOC56517.1 antirepressor [Clostridium botulinum]MCD3240895.1 phage antirepressor Ant [Clostridium botulinum D/C]
MNNLQVVDKREILGKDFKIYGTFENPLFLAKDVAEWIEHSNPRMMLQKIDEDEKVVNNVYTLGGSQESLFLTEDGLYEVLMQSRKQIAKVFKKQVKQILKDIRKHGMYAKDDLLENPDLLIQVATELKKEREEKRLLQAKIQQQQPKVLFADAVSTSNTSILIGELAKLLKQNGVDTGQNRLFSWLRDNGYLVKRKGTDYNMPTQYSMDLGLFEVKETSVTCPDGHVLINKTTKVTGKGQIYFINKFKNKVA